MILIVSANWGTTVDDIAAARERVVTDSQIVGELLGELVDGPRLEAAVHLLTGAVLCPAVVHNNAVGILLTGLQPGA